ncbi:MAG TPA: DUF6178 family protein, partial [Myxococcaceae bacterium]|nr:DUF6178 family protein [Myxococcaceae bacterium]
DRWARQPLALWGDALGLMPEEAAAVAALRRKRPLRALKVEGAEPVPFRSMREIHEAEAILDRAEAQRRLFIRLLGTEPSAVTATLDGLGQEPLPGPEEVLAAAVAQAVLRGRAQVVPIEEIQVQELASRLFDPETGAPAIRETARVAVRNALREGVDGTSQSEADRLGEKILARFLEEWGPAFRASGHLETSVASALLPVKH